MSRGQRQEVCAMTNSVKLGSKPTLTHHQRGEEIKCCDAGKETVGKIAQPYNISRCTNFEAAT